jgi:hypothetical protein
MPARAARGCLNRRKNVDEVGDAAQGYGTGHPVRWPMASVTKKPEMATRATVARQDGHRVQQETG